MALLALGGVTLLGDELLRIDIFRVPVLIFIAENDLELRVFVVSDVNEVRFGSRSDERLRSVVTQDKTEPLDIECLS